MIDYDLPLMDFDMRDLRTKAFIHIDKQGNETSMGYSGVFSVCGVDEKGILACGKDKTSGFCHIWMLQESESEMGIIKRPHKVRKINVK